MVKPYVRFSLPLICGVSMVSIARADSLDLALAQGFGSRSGEIREILNTKKIPEDQGPENLIQAGDTLVFAHASDSSQKVPLYTAALQGFNHAAIVGGNSPKELFQSYAPSSDTRCVKSFQGSEPYIILRPKKARIKSRDFGGAVTRMLEQMSLIGYDYDDKFDTDVLNMAASTRAKLHADILSYGPGDPKPNLPKMYCSEVPVTVYALLGITPTVSISGADLVDIGLNEDVRAGKPKEVVANETATKLIEAMRVGFMRLIDTAQKELAKINKEDPTTLNLQRQLTDQLRSYDSLVLQLNQNQDLLEDYLRSRLGLCQAHQGNHQLILSMLKTLAFYFADEKPVVRPIDLLRDALSPKGNFDIVGVYPGGGNSPCF